MKRGEQAFTMIEMMVALTLFSLLFAVLIELMINSDMFFKKGQDRVAEHMEARKVLDVLSRELRPASPDWLIGGTHYLLTVTNSTRMDYYTPVFGSDNTLAGVSKVTYKLDPSDPSQLLMKKGTGPEQVVSGKVSSVRFGAGCAGCSSFDCAVPAADCPVVRMEVTTFQGNPFTLATKIRLQNQNEVVPGSTPIEEPEEGEF